MNLNDRLSKDFTLRELVECGGWDVWRDRQMAGLATFPGHGPRDRVVDRLNALALMILQPIRDHVGRPCDITSGYRCWAKNTATPGSSKTTQHVSGEAADFSVPGFTDAELRDLWLWIGWRSGLPFGQVIFEDRRPDEPNKGAWIHVSLGAPYRPAAKCGMRLTWTPAEKYLNWSAQP